MSLYEKIIKREEKIALVGLGYVGMPIAVEFAKHVDVIGFDINKAKVEAYKKGVDPTLEVGDAAIKESTVEWTSDETKLQDYAVVLLNQALILEGFKVDNPNEFITKMCNIMVEASALDIEK